MRKIARFALFGVAVLAAAVPGRAASGIKQKAEHVVMNVRMVARVPVERLSTIGLNYESYVFEVSDQDKKLPSQWIKVSYRFHQRETRMPTALWDYSLLHKFRLTRDRSCDEAWQTISTRYVFDQKGTFVGTKGALVFAENAPNPNVDVQTVLACYTVTPHDYQSTSKDHPVNNNKATVAQVR
jgi:hypothetical protein